MGLFLYAQTLPPLPPGFLHLLVGRKVSVIEEAIVAPMRGFAEDAGIQSRYDRGRSMLHIGEHQYKLLAGENVLSEAAPFGFSACCALIDEASLLSETFVNAILSRVTLPNGKIFLCANPGTPSSWLKKRIDNPDGRIDRTMYFDLYDNPTLSEANRDFYRGIFAGADYTRLVEGQWSVAEGAIFPQFKVVAPEELPTAFIEEVLVAVDPGHATTYASLVLARTRLNNLLVWDERYHQTATDGERTPRQHAEAVMTHADRVVTEQGWPAPTVWLVDPAAAGDCAEYRARDCFLPSVKKDVLAGLACLRTQLEQPTIYILNDCTHLIEELQGLVWSERHKERGEDAPDPTCADHLVDCLRYATAHCHDLDAYARYL